MDIRSYYRLIREAEATLSSGDQVMVSLTTKDGGRAGVMSEVPRDVAAKLIVENRARLATDKERSAFFATQAMEREAFEKASAIKRIQVQLMSELEQQALGKKPIRK